MMRRLFLGLILALSATVASAQDINNPPVYPIATAKGGTGAALTPVVGDLLCASSTTAFGRLADVALGQVLISGGTGACPSYSDTALLGNGLVGTPTFSFASDPDTGMYRGGTNRLNFGTNGIAALSINSVGTIELGGVGTTGISANVIQGTSNVNYLEIAGSVTTAPVTWNIRGTDSNVNFVINPKGTGSFAVTTSLMVGSATPLTLTTGAVGMAKMTASASAPGAAGGKLELVCGTAGGSAKLVVYAGTSGTAVTIADNIGTGVTGC